MRSVSKLTAGLAATALLVTATAPANARGWGPSYDHRHGSDAGAIIGAIVGVGLIAAIASAASSKNSDNSSYNGPPVDNRGYDERSSVYDGDPRYDSRTPPPRYDDGRGVAVSQDEAVDSCALAARDEGGRRGGYAEVREISGVSPLGNGWDVSGRIEQRASYRSGEGHVRGFRCAFQDGQVSALSLE